MEFIASPPVHRVLCADCGQYSCQKFLPLIWLHALLGTPIEPNSANLCIACLRNSWVELLSTCSASGWDHRRVDITEGIPKQGKSQRQSWCDRSTHTFAAALSFCKNCERFLSPPQTWTIAEPESRELLAICLKKLKGLNKVRLIDAGFIWTEPHSKRIKVKLTIQKEVRVLDYQWRIKIFDIIYS